MKLITIVIAMLILFAQSAACAEISLEEGTHQISETIAAGDFRAYVVEMGRDDALKVRLSEPNGARFDAFLTNYSAYLIYKNAIPGMAFDFYYLGGEFSAKAVSNVDYTYYSIRADKMVLIVDNTNRTDEGAPGSASIEVVGTITVSANFWGFGEMLVIGVVAVAMIAVVALAFRRRGRARPPDRRHERPSSKSRPESSAMHTSKHQDRPMAVQPAAYTPPTRLHPIRKLLRPVKRSSLERRKPLSPKRR
jgi:hypothetical protein